MSNHYIKELYKRCRNRYAIDTNDMSYGDWICANTTLKGKPFSFNRYPFQKQICDDMHTNMSTIKPSQIGLTEVQLRKALAFITRNRSTNLIFTFPDDAMKKKNSQTRLQPIVDTNKVFNLENDLTKPIRSIDITQVGQSFMHLTGAKESDATSLTADACFNDEIDLTKQDMIALFQSRVQGSDWKIIQRFSTPTHVGYGIDQTYTDSDQHEYLIKCDCCNHWQFPVFEPRFLDIPGLPSDINDLTEIDQVMIDYYSIDLLNSQVVCERCRAPLDLGRQDNRSYVPKFASRTHARGYKVNPFSTSTLSPGYVIQKLLEFKKRDFIRGWYNTVLGQAFTDSSARLTEAQIRACITGSAQVEAPDPTAVYWIGADMGQTAHLVMGKGYSIQSVKAMLFEAMPVEQLGERIKFLREAGYNIVGGCLDRHPYTPTADAIRDANSRLILPCEYRGTKEVNIILDVEKLPTHIQADRTTLLDSVMNSIRLRRLTMGGFGDKASTIIEHIRDLVREEVPEEPARYIKLTGNDHYAHALGFMMTSIKMRDLEYKQEAAPQSQIILLGANYAQFSGKIVGGQSHNLSQEQSWLLSQIS